MILARLLSAGKSLVGGENNASQYRMGHPGLLPKFVSRKNPFGAGKQTAAISAATENLPPTSPLLTLTNSPETQPGRGPDLPPLRGSAERGGEQEPKTLHSPSQAESVPGVAQPTKSCLVKSGWFKRGVELLRRTLSGARSGGVPAPLKGPKAAVQGELSLDNIKVVRNDLSDTDLEIVAGRAKGIGYANRPRRTEQEPKPRTEAFPAENAPAALSSIAATPEGGS